jgi:GTPase SAR1 family protein
LSIISFYLIYKIIKKPHALLYGILKNNKMTLNDSSLFNSKIKIIFLGDPTVGKTSIISAIRHK